MMAIAVVDDLVTRNPCLEKGAGVERAPEMSIATPEQVGAIAAAVDRRYRALVLTAAYAGCRWGELTGLRCRNLDLAKGTLSVVEQVVKLRGGQLLTREPKSASGRRVVHLPAGLIAELEAHVAQFVAPDPDALVFTSGTGGPLRQSNFRNRQWLYWRSSGGETAQRGSQRQLAPDALGLGADDVSVRRFARLRISLDCQAKSEAGGDIDLAIGIVHHMPGWDSAQDRVARREVVSLHAAAREQPRRLRRSRCPWGMPTHRCRPRREPPSRRRGGTRLRCPGRR